jgi:hypothetical protein
MICLTLAFYSCLTLVLYLPYSIVPYSSVSLYKGIGGILFVSEPHPFGYSSLTPFRNLHQDQLEQALNLELTLQLVMGVAPPSCTPFPE